MNSIDPRQAARGLSATQQARLVAVMTLIALAACSVALALAGAGVEAIDLVRGIHRDASLTEREKLAPPPPGGDLTDFLFLRRQLAGVRRFYLVLPEWQRKNPFVGGAARNFALFFLFPATAVDRIGEAEAAVGVDGVDLRRLRAAGSEIERSGDISVQLLRPR